MNNTQSIILLSIAILLLAVIVGTCVILHLSKRKNKNEYADVLNGGLTDELKDSELYKDMSGGGSFCFIGDSITNGTYTDGIPWYQPLTQYISGEIMNFSQKGWMVQDLIEHRNDIPVADNYVIAIGINDVLFHNYENASVTATEYIKHIEELSVILLEISPKAKLYFITPWVFFDLEDNYFERGNQYRTALIEWCNNSDFICINPEPIILSVIDKNNVKDYMYDSIHPNATGGAALYSYAVLKDSHDQRKAAPN